MRAGFVVLAVLVGPGRAPLEAEIDPLRQRIYYPIPGADRVQRQTLSYKTAQGTDLPLHVYTPAGLGATERRPAIVFIHGGPIPKETSPPDWAFFQSYGELAAASGFVGVTFKHRLYEPESYEQAASDLAAALAHVRSHAAALHVDPDRLALWAFSGGGSLLASALAAPVPWVRCVVSYYGIVDLRPAPAGLRAKLAKGIETGMSPVYQVEQANDAKRLPPGLVARAGLDDDWINQGVDAFVRAALAKGLTLDLLTHPRGRHGFEILDDTNRTREVIAATLAFVRHHLEAPSAR